jgi:hypothetical protein
MMKAAAKKTAAKPKPSRSTAPTAPVASPLPKTIINALPTGAAIAKHIVAIEALIPALEKELAGAVKAGPVQLARAFVLFHRINERLLSEEKALKPLKTLWGDYKNFKVPEAFEQAGVENVPLTEGFRVGITTNIRASVIPGQKEAAFVWLQENEAGDLIQPTLNASTLSAYAKGLREKNKDLPAEIFNVAEMDNTTVTKT